MVSRRKSRSAPVPPPAPVSPPATFLFVSLLLALGAVAYVGSFRGAFVYDDLPSIQLNQSIRQVGSWFQPALNTTTSGRPLLNASFGLNYALGGLSPVGYHMVNLLIHLANGVLVFGIVRRTAVTAKARDPGLLAFAAAGLWILHPLQTESVTYIVQRAESLAGLFYLLGAYAFIRSLAAGSRTRAWQAGALLAVYAGITTKETVVTAPLVFLLYDRTFAAGSFAECWHRRKGFYAVLFLSWLPLGGLLIFSHGRSGTVGFSGGISWIAYAASQAPAILRYLYLTYWPLPLTFDYGFRPLPFSTVMALELAVIALLLGATVWLLVRRPVIGFLAASFFLLLAPTSSVVPITTEIMAEHRMYLPLLPLLVLTVSALSRLPRPGFLGAVALMATLFLGLTLARNQLYQSALGLWADTVTKCPDNERAHIDLGAELQKVAGQDASVLREFREAVRLNPNYPEARNNLGLMLERMPGGRPAAIEQYQAALRIKPKYTDARYNLANALADSGDLQGAVDQYRIALTQGPDSVIVLCNLGATLGQMGKSDEAIGVLKHALDVHPDDETALYNMAYEYALRPDGRNEAKRYLGQLLRLYPRYPPGLKLQAQLDSM